MKIALFIKIAVLIATLAVVVGIIRSADKSSFESAFNALGIADGGVSGTANQANSLNLCRTRIRALTFPDGRAVEEAKGRLKLIWTARDLQISDSQSREIDTIAVEKWLTLHCIIAIEPTEDIPKGAEFRDYLTLSYIDGKDSPIRRAVDGLFSFEGRLFRSSDLESAVKDLRTIAGFPIETP